LLPTVVLIKLKGLPVQTGDVGEINEGLTVHWAFIPREKKIKIIKEYICFIQIVLLCKDMNLIISQAHL
jgi:hypothetical protein